MRAKNKLEHFFIFFCGSYGFFFKLLLLIYICFLCSTHLLPMFQSHIPLQQPRTTCSPAPPYGINWGNTTSQMRSSLIDPYMTIPFISNPWKHQKTKSPPAFLGGGHKTRRSTRKGSSDKIKTIEDLFIASKENI